MLTKDSFPLTHLFLCYQTLENTENYLYTRFSIETNGAETYGPYGCMERKGKRIKNHNQMLPQYFHNKF